ncbi:MAG: ribonuclease HI family protein [Candidatus Omnitrophica bacterium]|nr:ribonuclease HI family protein [Candidatus Omnitrophota bacterium]MBU1853275.1 ribonuclease HI family protein [Candidatus Omnitrophota bacterium]
MSKSIEIFIDGASRGNPGPSGVGIVFFDNNGNVVKKLFKFIGNTTNNIAEYTSLIYALQEALIDRYEIVTIKSDSELLTRQLRGEYKVKNENLRTFYEQFLHLLRGFTELKVISIDRKDNSVADKLANKAIDSRIDSSLKTE